MNISKEGIRNLLIEQKEQDYKVFSERIVNASKPLLGIRIPNLRSIAKEIVKSDYYCYLNNASFELVDECLLYGLVVGCSNMNVEDTIHYLNILIDETDNWSVCDITVASLKMIKKHKTEMWQYAVELTKADSEFKIRYGLIIMLDYFIDEYHIDQIIKICDEIKSDYYYVKMAVAWLLSIAFIKFSDKTMTYLNNCNLDTFTYNKTLSKITDSYRVSEETKKIVKMMHKK